MNATAPTPDSSTNVAPTIGSLLGTAAGLVAASKLGMNPFDAVGGSFVASIAAAITAGFHWLGKKTHIPGLG
jgi:hypothetical protein